MSVERNPAAANIASLRQGVTLLQSLDDRTYAERLEPSGRNGVGCQVRHCIDFYTCFLGGLRTGRIDYNRRERDPRVEEDRAHAAERLENLIAELSRLQPATEHAQLNIRLDPSAKDGDAGWCRSSVLRERQFLLSHTIHHYALIASLLEGRGVQVRDELSDLGVAASTLEHWTGAGA
jgi:hypothetical protein